jgi:asparagine synthase (glutamine-hydrolysing)
MCGIVGEIRFDGAPVERLAMQRMTDAIAHRGPDGEGVLVKDNVGLGHRRLAIIDLATGDQPMSTADQQVSIVFNGEIYNYRELRAELEQKGCEFRTQSDTVVLLQGWRVWGREMLSRLRGMFAFCIVDFKQRRWMVARDHFGIKPLWFRWTPTHFRFSSELHALREPGDKGNLEAVEWFLRFQYIPAPYSIYKDVVKLQPAEFLVGDFDGRMVEAGRYWVQQFIEETGVSEPEWLERFEAALKDSVRAHLVSDVPVGVLLSGGIDSTLIACQAAGLSAEQMRAFTIDFDVPEFGELGYATKAAETCGLNLHTVTVSDDFWDELPELVRHYGEPFGDNSAVPTWQLAKLARQHVPVVLAGDGGDEAFAGYRSYKRWLRKPDVGERMEGLRSRPRVETAMSVAWALAARAGLRTNRVAEWERNIAYVSERDRRLLWRKHFHFMLVYPCREFVRAAKDQPPPGAVSWAQHMDFRTYLPGAILVKSDIASMFHGLEIRTPFLDVELIKLACALPESMRFRTEGKQVTLKYLLKQSLRARFGDEFVDRPKKGFGGPREYWFYEGRPGRQFLRDVVNDPAAGLGDWFDIALINRWIDEHSPQRNRSPALWLLLVLGLWRRANADVTF